MKLRDISAKTQERANELNALHRRGIEFNLDTPESLNGSLPPMTEDEKSYLKEPLYSYQVPAVDRLLANPRHFEGDACGLGKTPTAIAYMSVLHQRCLATKFIIVCDNGIVEQWATEIGKFSRFLPVVYRGSAKERKVIRDKFPDVLIVSYDLIRRDESITIMGYQVAILDESTAFKTPTSSTSRVIKVLTHIAARSVPMSATIVTNSPVDAWSQFNSCNIDVGFGTLDEFKERYVIEEQVSGIHFTKSGKRGGTYSYTKETGYKNLAELRTKMQPHIIRRTPSDENVITDLPDFVFAPVYVDMEHRHRKAYKTYLEEDTRPNSMTLQILTDVWIDRSKTKPSEMICAPKVTRFYEMLQTDFREDKKIVVYAYFLKTVSLIEKHLDALGITYVTVTGQTEDNSYAIHNFKNDPDVRVIITNTLTQGANLQVANRLIMIDTPTNPKTVEQLIGRIRRSKSDHSTVFIHPFLTSATHEIRWYKKMRSREADSMFLTGDAESNVFPELTADMVNEYIAVAKKG